MYLPFIAETQHRVPVIDGGNLIVFRILTADFPSFYAGALVFGPLLEMPQFRSFVGGATGSGLAFAAIGGWYCVGWSACRALSQMSQFEFPSNALRRIRWILILLMGAIGTLSLLSVFEMWRNFELLTASKYVVFTLAGVALGTAIYLIYAFVVHCGIALRQLFARKP